MPDFVSIPDMIRNPNVDGLIVVGADINAEIADMFHPVPVVWQGGLMLDIPVVDQVLVNNRAVGILAADYFLKRGMRNVAYLNHDRQHSSFSMRFSLFRDQMKTAADTAVRKYEVSDRDISELDMWSMDQVRSDFVELVEQMLADGPLPDGIYVPTDQQCAVLYSVLRERGIMPGKDVVIVSCNNDAQWLVSMHPPPATIDACTYEQGQIAVKMLLDRINNPTLDPMVTMITPKVVSKYDNTD
jgi:LacI family transcriptional regulator